MRRFLAMALMFAACGGGSTSPADPLAATGACAVAAPPTAAPYAVELQFRVNSTNALYLAKDCGRYLFAITSCQSGFTDHLGDSPVCACSCDLPRCGIVCGACLPDEATKVVGGDSVRVQWGGVGTTLETKEGATCTTSRALPAGRYRVSIQVYDTAEAALTHTGARVVSKDFELPAAAGLVDVPLAP